jgi:DNA-binding transcriptional LysR family regulator
MRPAAIIWFERLFLFSLTLGVVQAWVGHEQAAARGSLAAQPVAVGLSLFVLGGMTLLVSRGRIWWARWVLALLYLGGLPLFLVELDTGRVVGWAALSVLQAALQGAGIALLFTRAAKVWLTEE